MKIRSGTINAEVTLEIAPLLMTLALLGYAGFALAAGPCDAFKWDARQERAIFATPARDRKSGSTVSSAPIIALDKHYRLLLAPQAQVAFAVPPDRKPHMSDAYAGLVRVHIRMAGSYRVALSARLWIDAVQQGKVVPSTDFTGAPGCNAPHKIVLYRLAAGDLLLQVSSGMSPQTGLSVTNATGAPSR